VRDDPIAQARVGHAGQHCGLDHSHNFTGLRPKHGETKNAVASRLDQSFIKPRVSEIVRDRKTAVIGSVPMRTAIPWRRVSPSLGPTRASGGSVNMHNEAAVTHDKLRATLFVIVEMPGDQPIDQLALALQDALHVNGGGTRYHSKPVGVVDEVGDFRAPDFVFAQQAVCVRAGTANPLALDDSGAVTRLGHVPGQIFAALSAAKDEHLILFDLRHL
jgi:hypothetical protein